MIAKLKQLISKPAAQKGNGFTYSELENGDMLCSIESPVRSECLLRPCEFDKQAYYFVNALELPRVRHIALEAAAAKASMNYTIDELTDALAGIIKTVQTTKKLSDLRVDVQRRCDVIAARVSEAPQRRFLEEISLIFMVLKGENPFMYSEAFHDQKRGILNTEIYAQDFFFDIAREVITNYSNI